MAEKPTYKELEKIIEELEQETVKRKELEEELRKYQFMIESAHDAIFFKDLGSRYISANDKTLEAFGLSREDVIGKNDYELMPNQKEAKKNVYDDQIVFKSGKPTEVIKHMTGSDGKEYWFQAIKVPQFDNDGKIIGLVGIARDITDQKLAQSALTESEKELKIKAKDLEELNAALKVLLNKRQEDKEELEEGILSNVRTLIEPYIARLKKSKLSQNQKTLLNIIESNLNEIISPFTHKLSSKYLNLTPTQIQVANLVKQGKTNKDISEILHVAGRTIAFHRENIRKKLGLTNKKTNLKTYLMSII